MYPCDKKDNDFNSKRVLQCFPPLAMYPFGLKGCKKINFLINAPFGRFSLAMYPSDRFFLKAKRVRALRRRSAAFGGMRRGAACEGYITKDLILEPFRSFFAWGKYFPFATYLLVVLNAFGLACQALLKWPQFQKIRAGFFLQFSLQVSF